ncbi:LruC domain-containing protein [Echinimonas agarilytica]|uniref:LruC domain-containing protein n=1 Tax=Echinimonas agarilytica TaxID=1215918 RepID=A0AA41W5Y0_9GAMM|nr:LruC domain-containing protein [Echinimonas agarilytica]MCM2679527.1 LruC domain-containing protein [Echinimonas agarilytica]
MTHSLKLLAALVAAQCATVAIPAHAAPFSSCPTQAFLIQKTEAELFGVNLATGFYSSLSNDLGTSGKLNAMGFNFHDDYLYAWSNEFGTLARIGADFQIEPLALTGTAPAASFYVGDVAVSHNTYYAYRKGSGYLGLFSINLDPTSADYLQWHQVIDGVSLNLNIFDFAFHPDNELLYSVDNKGVLWQIDWQSGAAISKGNVGQTGTFGAVYFDVDGFLYISRNSDGLIFKIDPTSNSPAAEQYAQGPASGNNDGARCAIAPVVDVNDTTIDYGDAPESFGTSLLTNGARHQLVTGGIRLGRKVDGEIDGQPYPLSDDTGRPTDDEDGISFVTGLQTGMDFIVSAESSANGLLNAWIDFNGNGQFDANEQVLNDADVVTGDNVFLLSVPESAVTGDVWSRFRISTDGQNQAIGGAPDGEVEDYEILISDQGTQVSYYPSPEGRATVAFEDNWPAAGDYDLNDLIVQLQTRVVSYADGTTARVELIGDVVAMGASYHNGLAIRLPGISPSQIDTDLIRFEINGELQTQPLLETGTDEVIAIIAPDVRTYLNIDGTCDFYRTQSDCAGSGQLQFRVYLPFEDGSNAPVTQVSSLPQAPFDPFIFATSNARLPLFSESPGRGLEIHLKNQVATDFANTALWSTEDDASDAAQQLFYQNVSGMPWAILIPYSWQHPFERIDVSSAYPQFVGYAQSSGTENVSWYLPENARTELLYNESGE